MVACLHPECYLRVQAVQLHTCSKQAGQLMLISHITARHDFVKLGHAGAVLQCRWMQSSAPLWHDSAMLIL